MTISHSGARGLAALTNLLTQLTGEQVFATRRLRCRRWNASDLESVYAVYADPEGARWVGDGQPISYSDSERWLEVTASNYATRGYGMFALEESATSELVGFCGLVHPEGQTVAETKYALYKSFWGRGYATEALIGLRTYASEEHDQARVIATVAVQNLASQRVLVKAGFGFHAARLEGEGETTLVYQWSSANSR